MNVLVTGGAGYLGAVVSGELLRRGHRVRVLDALLYGGRALLGLYPQDGFEFVRGDLRAPTARDAALEGVEAVVHLAAIVGDPACARQPDAARAINRDASLELFHTARRGGVERFVFASTCSNYGKMADPSQLVTETSELRPVSLYAETKVAVEKVLLDAPAADAPAATVLRFATLYGLAPRMRFDLTVSEFAMELCTKRHLEVYGAQFWRPYLHVRDAARAVALVLAQPRDTVGGQVYNVGNTRENYQKRQLVELVRREVPGALDIRYVERQEDPRDYRVSFEKIACQLGFAATRTVRDGIREVVDAIAGGVIADIDNPAYHN